MDNKAHALIEEARNAILNYVKRQQLTLLCNLPPNSAIFNSNLSRVFATVVLIVINKDLDTLEQPSLLFMLLPFICRHQEPCEVVHFEHSRKLFVRQIFLNNRWVDAVFRVLSSLYNVLQLHQGQFLLKGFGINPTCSSRSSEILQPSLVRLVLHLSLRLRHLPHRI